LKKVSFKILLVVLSALFSVSSQASGIKRIRSIVVDKGEVQRVMMVPGLASVILFPCDVDEAVVGRQEDLKVQISPTTKRQLTLSLSSGASGSTNLLIRCGDKSDPFVFDIISNHLVHQDVVKVRGHFGGPEIEDANLALIDSSLRAAIAKPSEKVSKDRKANTLTIKPPKLMDESK
jgi:hypothetical protein